MKNCFSIFVLALFFNVMNVNAFDDESLEDMKGFMDAICNSNYDQVANYLGNNNFNINARSCKTGSTALHLAVANSDDKMVEILLQQKNINISIKNNLGFSARHYARKSKNPKIRQLFQNHESCCLIL